MQTGGSCLRPDTLMSVGPQYRTGMLKDGWSRTLQSFLHSVASMQLRNLMKQVGLG